MRIVSIVSLILIACCTALGNTHVPRLIPTKRLIKPIPQQGDRFGEAVTLLGNNIVVTAREDEDFAGGGVYLFTPQGEFIRSSGNPSGRDGAEFGSYATGVGDDQLLVSAPFEANETGQAYLFDMNGELIHSFASPESGGRFGSRFLLANEETIFIGSDGDQSVDGGNGGAVYAYSLANGFELEHVFINPTPSPTGCFGSAGALVGDDKILLSDRCDDGLAQDGGSAHLFDLNGELIRSFQNPAPHPSDNFGSSVAVAGDRFLIGGTQDDHPETGLSAGAAFIFEQDGTQFARIDYPNPAELANGGQWFGWNAGSYSYEGEEYFLVGSVFHSKDATQETHRVGAVFVLNQDGDVIQTLLSPDEGGQQFGASFTQFGDGLLIGETMHNGGWPNGTGAAWIFEPADRYDSNLDGSTDVSDINLLCSEIANPSEERDLPWLDLNGDDDVTMLDAEWFLSGVGSSIGDADLNRAVDFSDFLRLATNFGQAGNWSHGDFDCNGQIEFEDFLLLSDNFGFDRATNAVPEPQFGLLLLLSLPLARMMSLEERE